jgi:hypothetical protein
MMNIPGIGSWRFPSADPPYPVTIGGADGRIETDDCGKKFEVFGDKHAAAKALLERGLDECQRIIAPPGCRTKHREGAFNFILEERNGAYRVVDIAPHYDFTVEGIDFSPEKRPEVLEMIEIVKKMLEMRAFL